MERLGQILYSLKGDPHKASSRKKQIFDKHYDEIFGEKVLNVEKSPEQIKKYFYISVLYKEKARMKGYDASDQKVFYILYLQDKIDMAEEELIEAFEDALQKYNPEGKEPMIPSRKLVSSGFKSFVDKEFSVEQP